MNALLGALPGPGSKEAVFFMACLLDHSLVTCLHFFMLLIILTSYHFAFRFNMDMVEFHEYMHANGDLQTYGYIVVSPSSSFFM